MSSFIERFSVAGSAGVLVLMVVLGAYGFASLLTAEPGGTPTGLPSEEFLVLEGRGIPIGSYARRPQVTPAPAPGEPSPAEPEPLETDVPVEEALLEFEPAVLGETLFAADVEGPAAPAAAAPAPAPAQTAVASPGPVPNAPPPPSPEPPPRPTPTPEATPAPEPTLPPLPSPEPTLPVP